jgi:zinc-binding in reverse transcriptase
MINTILLWKDPSFTIICTIGFYPKLQSSYICVRNIVFKSTDRSILAYIFLNSGGVNCYLCRSVWALKISLKVKLFWWLSLKNRILTQDNVHKRGWSRSLNCCFCAGTENVDHLFFHCLLSAQIWNVILLYIVFSRDYIT